MGNIDPNSKILKKVKNKEGLAEVAIQWFWQRHANYISTKRQLLEKVVVPINVLNKKVDHLMGTGQQKRAERWAVSLDFRIQLMHALMDAPLDMPRRDSESSSSGDETNYLPGEFSSPVKTDEYEDGSKKAITKIASITPRILFKTIQSIKDEKKPIESKQKK